MGKKVRGELFFAHTMYVDKPMKGHNLMQAIARVNPGEI